tara:strand:+ start:673 stop:930 length:258 start_codon:yes stop_codon:yes gene_type:complete
MGIISIRAPISFSLRLPYFSIFWKLGAAYWEFERGQRAHLPERHNRRLLQIGFREARPKGIEASIRDQEAAVKVSTLMVTVEAVR